MKTSHDGGKTTNPKERLELEAQFLEELSRISKTDRALFKRNAGKTIAQSRGVIAQFYRMLPPPLYKGRDEELYFLVATLFGWNPKTIDGNFGTTMRKVKVAKESESIDRRFRILLDSEFDQAEGGKPCGGEMAWRLRHAVRLAAGAEVGIDWVQLLKDLSFWGHPEKRVKKRWAKDYFAPRKEDEEKPTEKEANQNVD